MAVGVAARPFPTRAGTGTGALTRVAAVGGNLPFARHGQAAVERSLDGCSSRRTSLPSMIRSALSRSWCAKLARYSATQPSALLRRDSSELSILSQLEVRGRFPDGFRFDGGLIEIELTKYFRNLLLSPFIGEPCIHQFLRLISHVTFKLSGLL